MAEYGAATRQASGKQPKSAVDYSPGHPDGDHCAVCEHFRPPHGCTKVLGEISPSYWCKLFERA